MGRGYQAKIRRPLKYNAGRPKVLRVTKHHGVQIVTSRLSERLRKGGRRKKYIPKTPKVRVPGDDLMRGLVGGRSYTEIGLAMGVTKGEVSLFCRGEKKNPHVGWLKRFGAVVGVGVPEVWEALEAIWGAGLGREGKGRGAALTSPRPPVPEPPAAPIPPIPPPAPRVRPAFERLISPPAPFYRERADPETPLTIGYAPRFGGDDDPGFVWDD